MKKILFLSSLLFTALLHAQTPCQNGFAGSFPCEGYDLLDSLSLNDLDADAGNDSWGWTDPETGVEYALIGLNNGTAFIDISNPTNVIFVGKLPTHTTNSAWRDVKVYGNYAFIVSEARKMLITMSLEMRITLLLIRKVLLLTLWARLLLQEGHIL